MLVLYILKMRTEEEIDDLIDYWHTVDDGEAPLHEFLGWTWEEYKLWVETGTQPNAA